QIAIGAAPTMTFVVLARSSAGRSIRRLLHLDVQGGIHLQAAFMNRGRTVLLFEITSKLFREIWRELVRTLFFDQLDRMRLCFFALSDSDLPFRNHAIDGVIAARQRALGMKNR